jgi:hypothetical protein
MKVLGRKLLLQQKYRFSGFFLEFESALILNHLRNKALIKARVPKCGAQQFSDHALHKFCLLVSCQNAAF